MADNKKQVSVKDPVKENKQELKSKEESVKVFVNSVWASPERCINTGFQQVPKHIAERMVELGTAKKV